MSDTATDERAVAKASEFPNIEVNLPLASGSNRDAWVKYNGEKLAGVTGIELSAHVHEATRVTLHLLAHVSGQVEGVVELRDQTITSLVDVNHRLIEERDKAVAELSLERARAKKRWWHFASRR